MSTNSKKRRPANSFRDLKRLVENIADPEDKLAAECMLIITSAVEIGANVDRLVEYTGYPRVFVEAISRRMRSAGLWIGEVVDDVGWWDQNNNLTSEFYAQAQVASGRYLREWTQDGRFRYLDAATGEVVSDWSPLNHGAEARRVIRTLLS